MTEIKNQNITLKLTFVLKKKKKQFLNLDFCITCLNSESEWVAPCVPTQSVHVNIVNSVGPQTYNTKTHFKARLKLQNHFLRP